jgi:hypothetical protein
VPGAPQVVALSSRLLTARASRAGEPTTVVSSLDVELAVGVVAMGALERLGHELVEADRLVRLGGLAAREIDEVVGEAGQLRGLRGGAIEQRAATLARDVGVVAQDLDVRAQAGDRRTQLVRRVGDELALDAHRLGERVEHCVEARGQAGDLVVAVDLDAAREVAGLRDVVGGGGELAQRRDRPRRTSRPRSAASSTPNPETASRIQRTRDSSESVSASDRPISSAPPLLSGSTYTRTSSPSTRRSRRKAPPRPAATARVRASTRISCALTIGTARPSAVTFCT